MRICSFETYRDEEPYFCGCGRFGKRYEGIDVEGIGSFDFKGRGKANSYAGTRCGWGCESKWKGTASGTSYTMRTCML